VCDFENLHYHLKDELLRIYKEAEVPQPKVKIENRELLHLIEGRASCFIEASASPQALLRVVPTPGPLIIGTSISIVQNKNPVKSFAIHLHLIEGGDFLRIWVKSARICGLSNLAKLILYLEREGYLTVLNKDESFKNWEIQIEAGILDLMFGYG
jgi:hypothetical protein